MALIKHALIVTAMVLVVIAIASRVPYAQNVVRFAFAQ